MIELRSWLESIALTGLVLGSAIGPVYAANGTNPAFRGPSHSGVSQMRIAELQTEPRANEKQVTIPEPQRVEGVRPPCCSCNRNRMEARAQDSARPAAGDPDRVCAPAAAHHRSR